MSCATPLILKQGDSFAGAAVYTSDGSTPMSLVNWTLTSQVRNKRTWELVSDVTFTLADQSVDPGKATFEAVVPTSKWPVGTYVWDVKFSHPTASTCTESVDIQIVRSVTGGLP